MRGRDRQNLSCSRLFRDGAACYRPGMPRWSSFLICMLIFLPTFAGFIMLIWPAFTSKPLASEIDGDHTLVVALAVIASATFAAVLFWAPPRSWGRG